MDLRDIFNRFKGKKSPETNTEKILQLIFNQEAVNLISIDRGYYEMIGDKIANYNGKILKIAYDKDLGRLRINYPSFYIDVATVDIKLVDFMALFSLGVPILTLKVNEKNMKLKGELEGYSYEIETLGLNLNFDVDNLN